MSQLELQQALARILWIGGAPDSGKTSVAEALATKYGLQLYSFDEHAESYWLNHFSKDPSSHGYGWMAKSWDERWVLQSPESMIAEGLQIAQECFPVVLADLLAMAKDAPVIAEGFELLPDLVAPVLASKGQAIGFLPTEAFQYDSFVRRGKPTFHGKATDPTRAARNHFARDRLWAYYIRQQVLRHKLRLLEIDGSLALDEVITYTKDYFNLFG
ncbi:MAG: hypothetical protein R3C14_01640 [Caldilineaceae bacterium]